MKTLKIALILLLSTFIYNTSDAQILRNSFLMGGSMNFDHNSGSTKRTEGGQPTITITNPTTTVFGLAPRFGYFVADNFCIGLNLDFRLNSATTPNTTTTTRLIAGPFVRYYAPLSDNVYVFGELSFGGGLDNTSEIVGQDTTGGITRPITTNVGVTNIQVGVGPGLNFFINEYIAFEALAKYTYSNATSNFSYTNPQTNALTAVKSSTVGNNIAVTLGLQIYFRAITSGIKN